MSMWHKRYIVLRSETGIDVVVLHGEVDHHEGTPRLERTLTKLRRRRPAKIILDFRDVTYCCSSAIAVMLDASEAVRSSGGALVCACVSGAAREPMDLLDIPDILPFFDSTAEALEALEKGAVGAAPTV